MIRFLILLITLTASLSSLAQDSVTGTVVEASGHSAIPGANVLLKDANGKILAYGTSNASGRFTIKVPPPVTRQPLLACHADRV